MTFEEKMDRLTERHEAMAMNLELMIRESETQRVNIDKLLLLSSQDGEHIRGLARIAELHNAKLESLSNRITKLEGGA